MAILRFFHPLRYLMPWLCSITIDILGSSSKVAKLNVMVHRSSNDPEHGNITLIGIIKKTDLECSQGLLRRHSELIFQNKLMA